MKEILELIEKYEKLLETYKKQEVHYRIESDYRGDVCHLNQMKCRGKIDVVECLIEDLYKAKTSLRERISKHISKKS